MTIKELQIRGTSLPSHSNFLPIEQIVREKYGLPELSLEDDPITDIYLRDEIILLEEFRNEIENIVRENLSFLSPELRKCKVFFICQVDDPRW